MSDQYTTSCYLVFGQKARVGISNLLVEKKVMDKLHTEKELNQVTSIPFHGALKSDPPLTQAVLQVNEFKASHHGRLNTIPIKTTFPMRHSSNTLKECIFVIIA